MTDKVLIYTHPYDLSKLADELIAAIPSVRPVVGPDGKMWGVMTVAGLPDGVVEIIVPEDVDEKAIAAVIAAHDPTPKIVPAPGPTQPEQLSAFIAAMAPALGSATTLGELKTVFGATLAGLNDIYGTKSTIDPGGIDGAP